MYLIAFFGALMALLSAVMVANPEYWSREIVKFSKVPCFHSLEILSRLIFGITLIAFADQTLHPTLISVVGFILVIVGIGLAFTPPSKHRQFAVWSAQKFRPVFRPAGAVSFAFGIFIVHAALSGLQT